MTLGNKVAQKKATRTKADEQRFWDLVATARAYLANRREPLSPRTFIDAMTRTATYSRQESRRALWHLADNAFRFDRNWRIVPYKKARA